MFSLKNTGILPLYAAVALLTAGAYAQTTAGIEGCAKSSSGSPVAGALIFVHAVGGNADRSAVSGSDGCFTISGLAAGQYLIYGSKGDFVTGASHLEVPVGRLSKFDVVFRASESATDETLLQGFAALQRRIDQLEAQMKDVTDQKRTTDAQLPLIASLGRPVTLGALPEPKNSPLVPVTLPTPAPPAAETATADAAPEKKPPVEPFSDADWTWLNGNSRQKDSPLDSKYFTGEFRADAYYGVDFNQPKDHTMGGSSEVFRSDELQLEDLSIGGDFHVDNVRGRVLLLDGMFAATTARNDASSAVGQWDVRTAYRYVSEAYGGYHFNVNHGLNVDAGIFVSYVGLFSYHNFDNWAYQPSYVSSNTPWFFNGVRVQWFPTAHLKIEPWFVNGWQSYNKFNSHPGFGGQIKWAPKPWLMVIGNQYGFGEDTLGVAKRQRYHTDDSVEVKYYDNQNKTFDKAAFTFTGDLGCESGGGVTCTGGKAGPKQAFLGYMVYNRFWFHKDLFGLTLGGGQINNPGRYLTLVLPINGADAVSGSPYFPQTPGTQFKAYDATATFDYMPRQYFTWRMEFGYRHASVPYFSGRGGITPPLGNNGNPAEYVCNDGAPSLTTTGCGSDGGLWNPDLRRGQALLMMAFLIKF